MPHFLSLVTVKQNKLNKILFEIELVLFEKRNKLMPHFLSLVTIKQNKLSKILFEIELVLLEKRNKLMPHFLSLVTIKIKQMEAMVFLFFLDKFNNSLPSIHFQLLIIILNCNSEIVFLSYKDQHPLAPKPISRSFTPRFILGSRGERGLLLSLGGERGEGAAGG